MDGVAPGEVAREVHPVGAEVGDLSLDVEAAEDGRRRGLARADRIDAIHTAPVDQREQLRPKIGLRVPAVIRVARFETAQAIEQPADRSAIESLVGAPVQEPVVGVDREPGSLVVDAGLGDVEVKRRQALLDQLDEAPGRAEIHVLVEHRVAAPGAEAPHLRGGRVPYVYDHTASATGAQRRGEVPVGAAARGLDPQALGLNPVSTDERAHRDPLARDVRSHHAADMKDAPWHCQRLAVNEEGVEQVEPDGSLNRGGGRGRGDGRRRQRYRRLSGKRSSDG